MVIDTTDIDLAICLANDAYVTTRNSAIGSPIDKGSRLAGTRVIRDLVGVRLMDVVLALCLVALALLCAIPPFLLSARRLESTAW